MSQQQATTSQQQATNTAAAVTAKLPDFYTHNPEGWFINAEAQFALAKITDEKTKFYHAVKTLDPKTSEEIQHFLTEQCQNNDQQATPYTNLKKQLLKVFGKSKTSKMAELLTMHSFNENGAESTLRRMRVLCTDMDTMLQCKLLSMAPLSTRTAVASQEFETAEDLAQALDKAREREKFISPSISSVSEETQQYDIAAASKTATFNRARQDKAKHTDNRTICFYHDRFGYKAKKCTGAPCKFAGFKSENFKASN